MATDPTVDPEIDVTGTKTAFGGSTDRLDRDLAFGERLVIFAIADREALVLAGFDLVADGDGVVMTAAEHAELSGIATAGDPIVNDRDDDLVLRSLPFLLDDANDSDAVIAALNGIAAITPRLLRAAYIAEEANLHRGEVLDALDERLGRELVRIGSEEPWAGYGKASIAAIIGRLDSERPLREERGTWADDLEHVHAFEEAHKARRAILDYPEAPAPTSDPGGHSR